jgi:hypothetical protein
LTHRLSPKVQLSILADLSKFRDLKHGDQGFLSGLHGTPLWAYTICFDALEIKLGSQNSKIASAGFRRSLPLVPM